MQSIAPLALALAAATLAAPAFAQFQKPEDAIKYRKASFTVMATHFGRIGAMANGRIPFDARQAADSAAIVETMARLPWEAFGPGTDKGDTRALPAIWSEQAKFKAASGKNIAETVKVYIYRSTHREPALISRARAQDRKPLRATAVDHGGKVYGGVGTRTVSIAAPKYHVGDACVRPCNAVYKSICC